ncbi:MAG: M28 family peptidase, partial [Gemmatimonadetes bacterium]|nr:M28 family peptidase [Gemmatimonadota bacterium]
MTRVTALCLTTLSVACSRAPDPLAAQTDPEAAAAAAETISADDLMLRIGALAHDSMRGRATPSPELTKAAHHIAGRFESFGLLPVDGDSYLQSYPLTFSAPGPTDAQDVRIEGVGGGALANADFIAIPTGPAQASGALRVVDLDPGEDLDGAVAAVRVTQQTLGAAISRTRGLLDAGASGVLFAVDESDDYFAGLRRFFDREQMSVGVPNEMGAPTALVRHAALPEPLREALDSGGQAEGYRATLRSSSSLRQDEALNTIGWIEGSDPALRDEYVVFTAHMDHLGVGRTVTDDSIYNGADDDASGTAAVIELAEAFASLPEPPRRSLIFLTVSGEERGLLGSAWYADNPLFPIENTVANLNIDMIGRNWRDTVVAIGRDESTLGERLEDVIDEHPELGLVMIDDPWPEENFYFRSDHYNFARKGVPILFFFTGTHEDYHGVNDEP